MSDLAPFLAPFLGPWSLDPEHPAPAQRDAVVTIIGDADHLYLHTRWRSPAGERLQIGLVAVLDGQPHPLPGLADATLTARLSHGRLHTELHHKGALLRRMERQLTGEGKLVLREEALTDGGEWVTSEARFVRAEVKQVLVYRRDLKMRKGKIAAQCAHATMAVFTRGDCGPVERLEVALDGPSAWWARRRMAKVVLSVDDEDALLAVHAEALRRGLPTVVITDAGRTEFKGVPTKTVVAVGPALVSEIDEITGPAGLVATKLA